MPEAWQASTRRPTLARRAFVSFSLVVAAVMIVSAAAAFFYVRHQKSRELLDAMSTYAREQAAAQQARFADMELMQRRANAMMAIALAQPRSDVEQEFDRLFPLRMDGTRRSAPGLFDGVMLSGRGHVRGIGAFMADGRSLTVAEKRQLLEAFEIVRILGEGTYPASESFYYFTPSDRLVIFAPDRPDRLGFYRRDAPADFAFQQEEFAAVTAAKVNPERRMRCTGLRPVLYDRTRRTWTTGCMTPFDLHGEQLGAWGQSLPLRSLVLPSATPPLPGLELYVVSREGRLLLHPRHARPASDSIGSYLDLTKTNDPQLRALWLRLQQGGAGTSDLMDAPELNRILSVHRLSRPDWYLVAALPSWEIERHALSAASFMLMLGLLTLAALALAVRAVLAREVVAPLHDLIAGVAHLSAELSDRSGAFRPAALPVGRSDEIGALARAFDNLAGRVRDATRRLEEEVALRTSDLTQAMLRMQASEERYRLLADHVSDIVLRLSSDGVCLYISPSFGDVTGLSPETLMGLPISEAIHREDMERVLAALGRARVNAPAPERVEFRARPRWDEPMWFEASLRMVPAAPGGGEAEFVCSLRDVRARKALEAQLLAARDRAEAASRAKSDFVAVMSHEVRTPMTGVLGMVELLEADPPKEQRNLYFASLRASAAAMMHVLDDILDFSRVEAGAIRFETVSFDVGALLQSIAALYQGTATSKGVALRLHAMNAGTIVRGDPTRLRQVLSNLMGNAVKFTSQGSVDLHASMLADDVWRFEVRDTGIGIATDVQGSLFDAFMQADTSTTRRYGGTGLGLAICKRLVEGMNGRIGVASQPGEGSTFWLELPLPAGEETAKLLPPAPNRDVPEKSLRVLVAEDNEVNRLLIDALLTGMGHAAHVVENGRLALEAVQADRFDVVLMDMQMPEMDGMAAAHAIRQLGGPESRIPIIALTADATMARWRHAEVDLDGFLAKPIDSAKLRETLARLDAGTPLPRPLAPADATPLFLEQRLAELTDLLGKEMLPSLLQGLAAEIRQRVPSIVNRLRCAEHGAARMEAHALRGAADNIGAARLAAVMLSIENIDELGMEGSMAAALHKVAADTLDAIDQTLSGDFLQAAA